MAKQRNDVTPTAAEAAVAAIEQAINGEDLPKPKPKPKPKRKPLSSGLQLLALIERKLADLPLKTQKMVVGWFREYEPQEELSDGQTKT